jgi:hypothetical protein
MSWLMLGFIFVAVLFFVGGLALGLWKGSLLRADLVAVENRITAEIKVLHSFVSRV